MPTWNSRRTHSLTHRRRCCQGPCERSPPARVLGHPGASRAESSARRGRRPRRTDNRLTPLPRRQADGVRPKARMATWPGTAIRTGQQSSREEGAMTTAAAAHLPVMLDRVRGLFAPALSAAGAVLVDATLGRAGHTLALLRDHPGLTVVGIDADLTAIEESRHALAADLDRVTLVRAVYDQLPAILADLGQPSVQGILFDLGVSSPQLDDPGRGFSYSQDAPLDMRMDSSGPLTAAEVVNTYPAARLARIFREYGEERFARRIADAIAAERAREPIASTLRLAEIIRNSIPAPARRTGGNPAKRTFQALRIEVKDELGAL